MYHASFLTIFLLIKQQLQSNLDEVEKLITRVNETLVGNGLIGLVMPAAGERKELPNLAPFPDNHPILRISHNVWEKIPAHAQQSLLSSYLCIHVTEGPHQDLEFSEENLERHLGDIHQVREMQGELGIKLSMVSLHQALLRFFLEI